MKLSNIAEFVDDKSKRIKIDHLHNSLLYRLYCILDAFNNRFDLNKKSNSSHVGKLEIKRLDSKLLDLQFFIPFIHINIDIKTSIENGE